MISAQFEMLAVRNEKALVAFVTAGDPSLEALPDILSMLESAGMDIIEVGLPFSDPIADGPVIQASSQRALDRGVTPGAVLSTIAASKSSVPIVLMGYYNTALRIGPIRFAGECRDAGVSGVILSDLPPGEAGPWIDACTIENIDPIFLVAPTSTDERLDAACVASRGFVYAVSRTGVTGATAGLSEDAIGLVTRIKRATTTPVCVGFGISSPDHVRSIVEVADGAVVGSWLVNLLAEKWGGGRGASEIEAAVKALKDATR